jgi:hypothetical protein
MLAESIETIIQKKVLEILTKNKNVELPDEVIVTDSLGEVIEKLCILHCRMWYLEDAIASATSDSEIAALKRKIDICFKIKRPNYVQAINKMVDHSIIKGKTMVEDSVKFYKGFGTNE